MNKFSRVWIILFTVIIVLSLACGTSGTTSSGASDYAPQVVATEMPALPERPENMTEREFGQRIALIGGMSDHNWDLGRLHSACKATLEGMGEEGAAMARASYALANYSLARQFDWMLFAYDPEHPDKRTDFPPDTSTRLGRDGNWAMQSVFYAVTNYPVDLTSYVEDRGQPSLGEVRQMLASTRPLEAVEVPIELSNGSTYESSSRAVRDLCEIGPEMLQPAGFLPQYWVHLAAFMRKLDAVSTAAAYELP